MYHLATTIYVSIYLYLYSSSKSNIRKEPSILNHAFSLILMIWAQIITLLKQRLRMSENYKPLNQEGMFNKKTIFLIEYIYAELDIGR